MTRPPPPLVVCFGELLLRLDATDGNRLVQAERFVARYTGAEANVAVLLASLGLRSAVASRVPEHEVGQACLNALRRWGVDTSRVQRGGERLGLLYVEPGFGARQTRVIYDRAGSSFATLDPATVDWPATLEGARWLHVSGTAGALGEGPLRALCAGLALAKSRGLGTSLDCNWRAGLWSRERMREALAEALPSVGLFVGSFADAELFCGSPASVAAPEEPEAACARWGELLERRYGIPAAGFTVRAASGTAESSITGFLRTPAGTFSSRPFGTAVVDRIGSGDAFAAGLIHGLIRADAPAAVVERATRAAGLKLTIPGDFALLTAEELDASPGEAGGIRR